MRKFLLLLLSLLTFTAASAYDFVAANEEGVIIYYNKTSSTSCEVTNYGDIYVGDEYFEYSGTIRIPEKVTYEGDTYTVTAIGRYAFVSCSDLSEITLPETITEIKDWAFAQSGLKTVNLPNSLITVSNYAFYHCENLESVTLPESLESIGFAAFQWCTRFTSVTIPESVSELGRAAFSGCGNLREFNGKYASEDRRCLVVDDLLSSFAPCGLTTYDIPDYITTIGPSAFINSTGIESIIIPENVTFIHDTAFAYCQDLKSVEILGEIDRVSVRTFMYCTSLQTVNLPESVTSIDYGAFFGCTSLNSFNIPKSVTTIGEEAFKDCSSLDFIEIPESVISIRRNAFLNTDIYNNASNWEDDILYISDWLIKGSDNISGTRKIKEGVKGIADYAFAWCAGLNSINIPESVKIIGDAAFGACSGLTSVTLPNTITTIGASAFDSCTSLESLVIPESVTEIGVYAFYNTPIYNNESNWENDALYISDWLIAFKNPFSENFIIKDTAKGIANQVFANHGNLKSVTLGNNLKIIGKQAFYGCAGLTEASLGNSLELIDAGAFYLCEGLYSITIPNSVKEIGDRSFLNCLNMTSLTIGENVKKIGEYAFAFCEGLDYVTVKNPNPNDIELGTEVFYEVPTSTCVLNVPSGSKNLYSHAEQWEDFLNIEEVGNTLVEETIVLEDDEDSLYYDFNGLIVKNPTHGIYIHKRKKVIVK